MGKERVFRQYTWGRRPAQRYSARRSITTQSGRTWQVKATTHVTRAKSVSVGAKIGSSSVVDTHKTRDKVGF